MRLVASLVYRRSEGRREIVVALGWKLRVSVLFVLRTEGVFKVRRTAHKCERVYSPDGCFLESDAVNGFCLGAGNPWLANGLSDTVSRFHL